MDPHSPEDEGPQSTGQPRLSVCVPLTGALGLSLSSRCRPRLLPLPIADRIAQHQHGVDVLSLPAHADPFEAGFDDSGCPALSTLPEPMGQPAA